MKKNTYYLVVVENIEERLLYFKILYQYDIFSEVIQKLKSNSFIESNFLQEDYKKNPENFRIYIIEKTNNSEEIKRLRKQYKEEFRDDLYPSTLSYHPPNYFKKLEDDVLINIDEFCYLPGGV